MRVIIVGAGVTGLSLAAMLRRLNIQCLVIEQKPDLEAVFDLPVVLWANALSCYRAFNIDQFLGLPDVHPEEYYGIRRASDSKWLLKMPNTEIDLEPMDEIDLIPSSNAPTATSHSVVSRVVAESTKLELATVPRRLTISSQVLKHSLRAHVSDVRFGRTVVGLSPVESGVQVHLDNGHVEWGDVIVGADGMHSTIRHLVYPNLQEAHTCKSQNMTQIDGFTIVGNFPETLGASSCEIWGKRKTFHYMPVSDLEHTVDGSKIVGFSATLYDNPQELAQVDPAGTSMDAYRHVAVREFDEFGPEVKRLLHNATVIRPTELLRVPIMPHWHYKRAVLLGDAAHGSFPSFLNQDASLCVEDAAMLATSLGRLPLVRDSGYEYAFRSYEKCRRARVQFYIEQSTTARAWASKKNVALRDGALRMVPGHAAVLAQQWLFNWSYRGTLLHYDPYAHDDMIFEGRHYQGAGK